MAPGATKTGPGESSENIENKKSEHNEKTTQVRAMSKFCEKICTKDRDFQEKIKKYHQKSLSKEKLKEEFKKLLLSADSATKKQLGITDGDIDSFLRETDCFDNQLLYEVEDNTKLRRRAHDELMENCILTSMDEYELTDEQKSQIKEALEKEDIHTLKTFLELPKFRKARIKKYLPSVLVKNGLKDINFTTLHNQIAGLPPTDKETKRIQDVWNRLMGGFQIREGESPQQAFERIQLEGSEGDLIADYEAFFNCPDTLISKENKKRILDFLLRQYLPLVPLQALEEVDKKAGQKILDSYSPPLDNIQTQEPERKEALKTERKETAKSIYQMSLLHTLVPTRNLSFETKIKLLGTHGSARQIKQKNDFYTGKAGGTQDTGEDFEKTFETVHGFKPDEIMDQESLKTKLIVTLKEKINNPDKFEEGNIMVWKTKAPDGQDMIGYYAIDKLLGDDPEEENFVKVRFLGNNRGPLSPSGIPRYYSGPQFYEYLSNCSDDGQIDFVQDGEEFETKLQKDGTRLYTQREVFDTLSEKYAHTEIPDLATLNTKIDEILYEKDAKIESDKAEEREIFEGMTIALWNNNECQTFQIQNIDENAKTVTLWDGWGSGPDSEMQISFLDFLNFVKEKKTGGNRIFRISTGKKKFGITHFNTLMKSEAHGFDGKYKNNNKISIREGTDGKLEFGETDKSGNFKERNIIKVDGGKRDVQIESIEGEFVNVRIGTFKQTKVNKEKGVIEEQPTFTGSGSMKMPLSWLWGYLQSHNFRLEKPIKEVEIPGDASKNPPKMSWWNIIKHTHSLGVILHGDLWNAPFKAWEEQHHKDHAFAGKLTAALAIEKAQNMAGPMGAFLRASEWPYLMIGDSNSTLHSYLNELVERIDGMGSYHRVRLIRKWGAGHFPDPKFMAAMFASMQIFGQLYPYDFDEDSDPRKQDWYWYNNIMHSGGLNHMDSKKFPHHMPPENEEDWPLDSQGNKRTEISMCYDLFNGFQHPILRNLGRRFEKYMNKGHEELKSGGPGNLNRRTNMEDKLEWMMSAVLSAKTTEAFGDSTELWLDEGYPTEITTMPYAAMLFGHREQQMLPATQESLRVEFQKTTKVPMFVFAQNRTLGNTFRETGIAFAYTISMEAGDELKSLCDEPSSGGRLHGGSRGKKWRKRFENFWKQHGKTLMGKLSGMRDPLLNMMINDRPLFDDLYKDMPESEKKRYKELEARSGHLQNYYDRLYDMQSEASHSGIRGSGYYSGDNFRFREGFSNGYPIMWIDWDGYLDANLEAAFVEGDGTKGDGVYNEMRGFLDKIPDLAEQMAKDMGFGGDKGYISRISSSIYEKNVSKMHRLMNQAKFRAHKKCSFYNVSAMILGMADIRTLTDDSMTKEKAARFNDYKNKMEEIDARAKEIAKTDYAESIRYRTRWWKRFEQIVPKEEETEGFTLEQIMNGENRGVKKDPVSAVTEETLKQTESILQGGKRKQNKQAISTSEQVSETLNQPQRDKNKKEDTENEDEISEN